MFQCIFVEGQRIPLIIQKSDGGFGYGATDVAAIRHRLMKEKADWIIYVTDIGQHRVACLMADGLWRLGQSQHFELIFGSAKKIGWISDDPESARASHVGFGLVMGEDGQKFRSRSGEVVRLVELLDEAKERCRQTIRQRREERQEPISDAELDRSSSVMGYGAVKYADLKNNRLSNYKFSYDEMLSLKGNTAVYLLYAYARICGILRNADRDVTQLAATESLVLEHAKEIALALQIARFPEVRRFCSLCVDEGGCVMTGHREGGAGTDAQSHLRISLRALRGVQRILHRMPSAQHGGRSFTSAALPRDSDG